MDLGLEEPDGFLQPPKHLVVPTPIPDLVAPVTTDNSYAVLDSSSGEESQTPKTVAPSAVLDATSGEECQTPSPDLVTRGRVLDSASGEESQIRFMP